MKRTHKVWVSVNPQVGLYRDHEGNIQVYTTKRMATWDEDGWKAVRATLTIEKPAQREAKRRGNKP